jgi:two-component system chemotaxis response regulator CheB
VNVFSGKVLALILTGMGSDGKQGCEKLKSVGATVWAQDQSSSVVYGMPQAVASAGISEKSIGLEHIADCLLSELVQT